MTRRILLVWVAGAALVAALLAFDMFQLASGATSIEHLLRRDFSNLWSGGQLAAARDWATLYDRAAFTAHQWHIFGPFGPRTFSYPPTILPLAQLFAIPPHGLALLLWLAASGALFVLAARRWWPTGAGPRWLAVLTPAGLTNLSFAHLGFLFGGLWLLAFGWLDRRPVLAGAVIGLFAMKPQLAVLIPLVLLLRGAWRAIISAAISTVTVIGLSLALYGRGAWEAFLFRAAGTQAGFIDAHGAGFARLSTSAATAVLEVGGGWPLAIAAQALLALLGIALVVVAALRGVDTRRLALLTATATFLVLPYALAYDLVVVAIGALALMLDRTATRPDRTLGAIGFVAPQVGIVLAYFGLPLLPLMLAGLAVGQFRAAIGRGGPADEAAARSA